MSDAKAEVTFECLCESEGQRPKLAERGLQPSRGFGEHRQPILDIFAAFPGIPR
ncbi:hypothetical protein QZM22_02795 [Burkholderia oklahomensis]|uniref:hypothetical protein n=1 Tax=Burkholderia oklahomensis TaxID=342113 RepID=UPI002653875C|nr:hypothetical protein [Burkholderia oklahomensis]MDN7671475.1 hypothetical protein [Burkholderia oklahomensis]